MRPEREAVKARSYCARSARAGRRSRGERHADGFGTFDTKSTKKARIAWRSVVHPGTEIQEDFRRAHAPNGCVQCVRRAASCGACGVRLRAVLKVKTNLYTSRKLATVVAIRLYSRYKICLKPESCPCFRAGDRLGRKGNYREGFARPAYWGCTCALAF